MKLRCDYPDINFKPITKLIINEQTYTLASYRPHKDNMLITLKEITSIDQAENFRNDIVYITEELAEKLEITFSEDVIDKKVFNIDSSPLGVVTNVLQTPAHDILVIKNNGKELLIPWIDKFVLEINETIKVDLTDLAVYGE